MFIKTKWLFLVFMVILLSACEQKTVKVAPETKKAPEIVDSATVRAAWEVQWDKTLGEAKKERRILIYAVGSVAPPLKEAIKLFKERYGLDLEVTSFGRGAEQMSRLFTERNNGLYLADIFMSGLNTNFETKQGDVFTPLEPALILPEVLDPKLWLGGQFPWAEKDRKVISYFAYPIPPIAINTQFLKPEDIKSYYDLLDIKWKGKIVANDPTTTGVGFVTFSTFLLHKVLDLDYFRQLVKQEPIVLRDQQLQIDWLARGKYPIALWPRSVALDEYREAGAPISSVPVLKEGFHLAAGGSALSLINRAPHPNATRVFINWLLSREGQKHMQDYLNLHSRREDISIKSVAPLNVRRPDQKYLTASNSVEEWVLNEQDRYLDMAKQVFAPWVR